MTDADLLRRILGAMRPDIPLDWHDNAWLAAKGLDTLEAIENEAAGVTLDPRPAPDAALPPDGGERVQCAVCHRWPLAANWPNHMQSQGDHWPIWPAVEAHRG